jgi:hypothetical protein
LILSSLKNQHNIYSQFYTDPRLHFNIGDFIFIAFRIS